MVQWLWIRLPRQGTRVHSLVWEDPTCRRGTKPVRHNYWVWALEPTRPNYWSHAAQLLQPAHPRACVPQLLSLCAATTEACAPRAHALQQEKPPQGEAHVPQWRVAPAHHTREKKARMQQWRPSAAKKKRKNTLKSFLKI